MINKVLYFTANWCCACKCINPLIAEYNFTKINIDEDEDTLCEEYGIKKSTYDTNYR